MAYTQAISTQTILVVRREYNQMACTLAISHIMIFVFYTKRIDNKKGGLEREAPTIVKVGEDQMHIYLNRDWRVCLRDQNL